eukprot:164229-Amphidinium_carterae.3
MPEDERAGGQVQSDLKVQTFREASALKWNEEEMTKLHELGTFVRITEDEAVGHRKIKTRYVYDTYEAESKIGVTRQSERGYETRGL